MSYLETGLAAIRSSQVALQTTANNIANADTEGYHRQRVSFETRHPFNLNGIFIGRGVDVAGVTRALDLGVESSLTQYRGMTAAATARFDTWQRIESVLTPGSASLDGKIASLFDAMEQLAAKPSEGFLRTQLVDAANGVAQTVNRLTSELNELATGIEREIRAVVDEANQLTKQIAEIDKRIHMEEAQGRTPNDLYDRRGELVNKLADLVGVDSRSLDWNKGAPIAANGWLIVTENSAPLTIVPATDGGIEIHTDSRVNLTTGRLAGLLDGLNDVRAMRQEVVDWFEGVRAEFDHVQATGLGLDGPFSSLQSTRTLSDSSPVLSQLNLPSEIRSGDLFVTVTDPATQTRTTHRVAIDADTDTLADVAARLDAIPGLSAFLEPSTGRLSIVGTGGHTFDFAGRLDAAPESTAITGTAVPKIGGQYTGEANARWTVTALDSGTVGVDSPLRLEVRDAVTNALIGTVDAGAGYTPGSPLTLANGVTLSFDAGTLNTGDSLTVAPVADPDETRLLSALGIRSFFTGDGPGLYAVNQNLARNPSSIATSQLGLPADTSNLVRFAELRNAKLFSGTETAEQRLATMLSTIGVKVVSAEAELDQMNAVNARLQADRDSISGVDVNEELVLMLRFQQAFQAAARYVTSVDKTIQELMNILA